MTLIEKRLLHNTWLMLYDPPVDGATPKDGAGNPMQSKVRAVDIGAKLALGFTEHPLGVVPAVPVPEAKSAATPVDSGKNITKRPSLRYSG